MGKGIDLARGEAPDDLLSAHQANEWADAATNGLQWLRNIRDGISTVDEAIIEMESNIIRIRGLGR